MFSVGFAYNTQLFKDAGITTLPTNYLELQEDCIKLTNESAGVYGIQLTTAPHICFYDVWKGWDQSINIVKTVNDKKVVDFNTPKVIAASTWFYELYTKYHVSPPTTPTDYQGGLLPNFLAGKVAITTVNPSLYVSAKKSNITCALMPTNPLFVGPEGNGGHVECGTGCCIMKDIPQSHKDAVWEFYKWWTTGDVYYDWCKTTGEMPTHNNMWNRWLAEYPDAKIFLDMANNATWTNVGILVSRHHTSHLEVMFLS